MAKAEFDAYTFGKEPEEKTTTIFGKVIAISKCNLQSLSICYGGRWDPPGADCDYDVGYSDWFKFGEPIKAVKLG